MSMHVIPRTVSRGDRMVSRPGFPTPKWTAMARAQPVRIDLTRSSSPEIMEASTTHIPPARRREAIQPDPTHHNTTSHAFTMPTVPDTSVAVNRRPSVSTGPGSGSCGKHPSSAPSQQNRQQSVTTSTSLRQPPRWRVWTQDQLVDAIESMKQDMGSDCANMTSRLLRLAWKKTLPVPQIISKKNWFAQMNPLVPVPANGTANPILRVRTKTLRGSGSSGCKASKEKREHYEVIRIKAHVEPVPSYIFHHVEITSSILSPDTKLGFVPHLRDLQDHEEPKYRMWLENLESMDKTSGFETLSVAEKVIKTIKREQATNILSFLDTWLDRLAVEYCTKMSLIRDLGTQTNNAITGRRSSLMSLRGDAAKSIDMFTSAFDAVFDSLDRHLYRITLREVLEHAQVVDINSGSKKSTREIPNQARPAEADLSVERNLDTYTLLGCLLCFKHSCEHGEYGVDNERKQFSVERVGGLNHMLHKIAVNAARKRMGNYEASSRARKPCSDDCYLHPRPARIPEPFTAREQAMLRTMLVSLSDTDIPVQCATAVGTSRPCWHVDYHLEQLEIVFPSVEDEPVRNIKPVPWYDRFKKILIGDWREHTITHQHELKDHFDPCYHDGPCTEANCPCKRAKVLCDRFCRCTVANCSTKFNGCACHSLGKTCVARQKDRPCICIQLNRECDPELCGNCGASDRANPRNADKDYLFMYGCQNCSLQRGKFKSVVMGKSTIADCGYGLFAAEDITQDEFVIEYVGELISQDEGVRREARRGDVLEEENHTSYLFTLLEQEGIWVDAAIYGNMSRYVNHQDEASTKGGAGCNVMPRILYVGGEYRIKFSAVRDIKCGEELFFNYGKNFPNLTKTLLDEQTKVQKKKARQKAQSEDHDLSKKKGNGKNDTKRKKSTPKPQKNKHKAFARVEVDVEDDVDEDEDEGDLGVAEPFSTKKSNLRKRKSVIEDDEEDADWRPPSAADGSASQSAQAKKAGTLKKGRKQLAGSAAVMRKTGNKIMVHIPSRSASEETASGSRRPRKTRKIIDLSDDDDIAGPPAPETKLLVTPCVKKDSDPSPTTAPGLIPDQLDMLGPDPSDRVGESIVVIVSSADRVGPATDAVAESIEVVADPVNLEPEPEPEPMGPVAVPVDPAVDVSIDRRQSDPSCATSLLSDIASSRVNSIGEKSEQDLRAYSVLSAIAQAADGLVGDVNRGEGSNDMQRRCTG